MSAITPKILKKFFGKCILSGEHAVLRGSRALVYPVKSYYLQMDLDLNSQAEFQSEFKGLQSEHFEMLFWGILEKALNRLSRKRTELKGKLEVYCQYPLAGGLGSSAALCVLVSEVLVANNMLEEARRLEFSTRLEDQFHGQSSGVDVAISVLGEALVFKKGQTPQKFKASWTPHLGLYYTGDKAPTSVSVAKVLELKKTNPKLFHELDQNMSKATELMIEALTHQSSIEGQVLLKQSLTLAQKSFEGWELVSPQVKAAIEYVTGLGATAMKLTGAGHGGFLLALWDGPISQELVDQKIIPVFS